LCERQRVRGVRTGNTPEKLARTRAPRHAGPLRLLRGTALKAALAMWLWHGPLR
jgi:hypothetical protein